MPFDDVLPALRAAADALDRDRVAELCGAFIAEVVAAPEPPPVATARAVLSTLRRKRFFAPMGRVADALLQAGQDDPQVHRQYAQALLDQHLLSAAQHVLERLAADAADPAEEAEALGLLGRVFKQRYLDASAPHLERVQAALRRAVATYHAAYQRNPDAHLWHGINAAALVARAARDGVPLDGGPDPAALAGSLLGTLRAKRATLEERGEELPAFDLATAMEAALALGEAEQALLWARRYTACSDAEAFELASTERQLREVWGLTAVSPLLSLIRAALLARELGHVTLQRGEARGPSEERLPSGQTLELVLGAQAYQTLRWYRQGLECARSVARIETDTGAGIGTGFLLSGEALAGPFAGHSCLLLTNSHVVSGDPATRDALRPDEAFATFEATDGGTTRYRVAQLLAESPPGELDFAVLTLEEAPALPPCAIARALPRTDGTRRLYVIGHPHGRTLSFSLQDNVFLGFDERFLHYRSPTDPGSSGSPVFNGAWEAVGLHHAGYTRVRRLDGQPGEYAANEGIRLSAILAALEATP
ncbi:MAG TPA: serine protease [Rubricoccaceae bacterium]|nr:serine protease [Rubricoccaceae bacterium]